MSAGLWFSDDEASAFHAACNRLPALATSAERHREAQRLVLQLYPVIVGSWAPSYCIKLGDRRFVHAEELGQVAATAIFEKLKLHSEKSLVVDHWMKYLHAVGLHKARAFRHTTAPLSGQVSLQRRLGGLGQHLEVLYRELGHAPSAAELVAAQNAEVLSRLGEAQAKRHGSLISVDEAKAYLEGRDFS